MTKNFKHAQTLFCVVIAPIALSFLSCGKGQPEFSYSTERLATDTSVTYAVTIRTDPGVTVEYGHQMLRAATAGQTTLLVPARDLPFSKSTIQVFLVGDDGVKNLRQLQIDNTPPAFSSPTSVIASETADGKWSFKADVHTGPTRFCQVNGVPMRSSPDGIVSFLCNVPDLDPFDTHCVVQRYCLFWKLTTGGMWQGYVDIALAYPSVDAELDFRGNDVSQTTYGRVSFKGSSLLILGTVTARPLIAGVVVQGQPIVLKPDGSFASRLTGLKMGSTMVEVLVTDKSGKTITKTVRAIRVPTDAEKVAEYGRQAAKISYAMLVKNPSRYQGQRVRYLGKIFHIEEEGSSTAMQVNVTSQGWGMWDDQIMVSYRGQTEFVQGDLVWVCGTVRGPMTYTSVAGWNITVPLIDAEFLGRYESDY